METHKILKDCFCEGYLHELLNYPRPGLKEKKLFAGDEVTFEREWTNFYGTYARVRKDNVLYDINPNNLEKFKKQNMKTGLKFGEAVEAAKNGFLISREGWNGKGMFVFQRPADEIDTMIVVNQVKSLPQSVKNWFHENHETIQRVNFTAYLCMKAADNSIVNGWLASQTDMLAEDWCIL